MKPYIKRTLRDVGCTVLIGIVVITVCWLSYLPYAFLYKKINRIEKKVEKILTLLESSVL